MSKLIQQLYKLALLISLAACRPTSAPLPTLAKLPTNSAPLSPSSTPVELTATTQSQQSLPPSWTPEPQATTAPTSTRRPSTNTAIPTQIPLPTRKPTVVPTVNSKESDLRLIGVVTNGSGEPMPNIEVQLVDRSTRQVRLKTKSDANGNYVLNGVPAGKYDLTTPSVQFSTMTCGATIDNIEIPVEAIGKGLTGTVNLKFSPLCK